MDGEFVDDYADTDYYEKNQIKQGFSNDSYTDFDQKFENFTDGKKYPFYCLVQFSRDQSKY